MHRHHLSAISHFHGERESAKAQRVHELEVDGWRWRDECRRSSVTRHGVENAAVARAVIAGELPGCLCIAYVKLGASVRRESVRRRREDCPLVFYSRDRAHASMLCDALFLC